MEKFRPILVSDSNGPVVEAHSLNLNFQGMGMYSDPLSEGNITVSGKQTVKLANGQSADFDLGAINVRLSETETLLTTMPVKTAEEKALKDKTQKSFDIWKACLMGFQTTLQTALKADYILNHPSV